MTYSLQEAFNISMARYHRLHCRKCLGECSQAAFRQAAWGSVPLAWCVRLGAVAGLCSEHVVWGGVVAVLGVLLCAGYVRRRPSLMDSARCFDRLCQTDSAVVNGLELVRGGAEDAFSLYAIQIGLEALREGWERASANEDDRKLGGMLGSAVLLLVSMLVVYLPLPGCGRACGESVAGGPSGDSGLRLAARYEGSQLAVVATWVRAHRQSVSGQESSVSAGRPQTMGRLASSHGMGGGQGEDRTSSLGAGGSGGERGGASGGKDEPAGGIAPSEASEQASGMSRSTGGGTLGGNGAEATEALKMSAAGGDAVQQGGDGTKGSRRMEGDRKRAAGPDQRGSSPMASREKGEQEGDEDATEGRSGENAHKKSRGAAAMLPVVPEPDTVQGRLGAGHEMRAVRASASASGEASGGSGSLLRFEGERVRVEDSFPDSLRTRLRTLLKAQEK